MPQPPELGDAMARVLAEGYALFAQERRVAALERACTRWYGDDRPAPWLYDALLIERLILEEMQRR